MDFLGCVEFGDLVSKFARLASPAAGATGGVSALTARKPGGGKGCGEMRGAKRGVSPRHLAERRKIGVFAKLLESFPTGPHHFWIFLGLRPTTKFPRGHQVWTKNLFGTLKCFW
jgi:hypothetical protein